MQLEFEKKYYHKQEGANECWFACFLMVRDMAKHEVSDYQKQKASLIANRTIIPDENVADQLFINGADDLVLRDILRDQVDDHYTVDYSPNVNSIVEGLSSGHPVIVGLNYSKSGGHYCVVIGVDSTRNKLMIVNPLSADGTPQEIDIPASGTIHYYKK